MLRNIQSSVRKIHLNKGINHHHHHHQLLSSSVVSLLSGNNYENNNRCTSSLSTSRGYVTMLSSNHLLLKQCDRSMVRNNNLLNRFVNLYILHMHTMYDN
jgi:hypothetical protein